MKYHELTDLYFKGLKSPDAQLRRDSALALGTAKADVIPRLVESLGGTSSLMVEGDARSISTAGAALAKHDPEIVGPRLLDVIQAGKPMARREAVATIRYFGHAAKSASGVLLDLLHDPSPSVRREAAIALGCVGANSRDEQQRQVDELCKVLRSADAPDIRMEAAWAIGQLDRWNLSGETLRSIADDPDPCVRLHIAAASGLAGGDVRPSLEILAKALAGRDTREKYEAAVALGGMGLTLSEGGDLIARPLDVALNDDNSKVLRYVANAVGAWRWGATGNIPRLQLLLSSSNGAVRWSAASAFCRIFERQEWMANPGIEHVWWKTVEELINAADRTYGFLVRALHDPEAVVRSNAAFALARICEFREQLAIPTMDLLRAALSQEPHPNVCLFLMMGIRDIVDVTRPSGDGLQQHIIAVVRNSFDSTRIRKQALSVLAALGPGEVGEIPVVLETFLDGDADSRHDLAEFLRKSGATGMDMLLDELWSRDRELQRIRAVAADTAVPGAQQPGLERMGIQAVDLIEQLRFFWRVGRVFRSSATNQMIYGQIEEALWREFKESAASKTIRNRLIKLIEFFEEYFVRHRHRPRSSLAFFEFVQGRPCEILEDGWAAWEEVDRYFQRLGATTR